MALQTDPAKTDRPYPGRAGRLPRRLDEVTPEWLGALLANRYPGIEVRGFETVEVINSHTTKLRLELDLNDVGRSAGIPRQVCLKSNWSEGIGTGDICELEARFYQLMGDQTAAPVPRHFYADWDGDGGGRGIVVMEDLARSPGHFGNSQDELGIDGVARGLESLASLHASLWNSPKLSRLPASMDTPRDSGQMRLLWNYIELNLKRPSYQSILPDWIHLDPERLSRAFDALAAYERGLPGPRCVLHGDAHQGNSFVHEAGERVWLDWQLARSGHPWRDVCYFAVGALSVEERRSAMADLLEHYRRELIARGADDVAGSELAWEHFRRWPVYGLQCWLGNVDQWGQSSGAMVERFARALEDFESIELLSQIRTSSPCPPLGEGAAPIDERTQQQLESLP